MAELRAEARRRDFRRRIGGTGMSRRDVCMMPLPMPGGAQADGVKFKRARETRERCVKPQLNHLNRTPKMTERMRS